MPCPNCKESIDLDLTFIIKNPISKCPHCDVIMNFTVDKEISKSFTDVLGEIEKIKNNYKNIARFK